ncbi:hypothetical protein DFH94DRAFT_847289 [Russula ochroleuca]|uniref:Uncharacterized protein n=1 Tax=Russula ochroleuca TaxID=152965 RepID=A0A9P5JZZ4_9AGAM|nr:hypothetical protein DFH94DRAFT_847289 [Russula ochroleuca]
MATTPTTALEWDSQSLHTDSTTAAVTAVAVAAALMNLWFRVIMMTRAELNRVFKVKKRLHSKSIDILPASYPKLAMLFGLSPHPCVSHLFHMYPAQMRGSGALSTRWRLAAGCSVFNSSPPRWTLALGELVLRVDSKFKPLFLFILDRRTFLGAKRILDMFVRNSIDESLDPLLPNVVQKARAAARRACCTKCCTIEVGSRLKQIECTTTHIHGTPGMNRAAPTFHQLCGVCGQRRISVYGSEVTREGMQAKGSIGVNMEYLP